MKTEDVIAKDFPLHYWVWKDDARALQKYLEENGQSLEQLDPRGRTPLMLAVTLERLDCVTHLLNKGANVEVENSGGWTVSQEAVATGNRDLLRIVLSKRDLQRHTTRMIGVPALLHKLKEAPDFYMEMKWEFTSWVPLVSRMCPSDVYKVYKRGSSVRIDTTLLGFDQSSWQRGNRSYLFKAENEEKAVLMEVDHEAQQVFMEELRTIPEDQQMAARQLAPSEDSVTARLTSPIVRTYLDTDKISFERNKSGLWGWRTDRAEIVNGRNCKVFGASNVELVTKSRTEHLSEAEKSRLLASQSSAAARFPLNSLLAGTQIEEPAPAEQASEDMALPVSIEEYFDPEIDLGKRDIGRLKETTTKVQKFKATLWLCEDYPLSLADQIMPIVDLMAISSTHFAKLRDFIQMQLPAGFPTKIEIPLFHVMNACITFGNTFALDEPVPGISIIEEDQVERGDDQQKRLSCVVDDVCFEIPEDYSVYGIGGGRTGGGGGRANGNSGGARRTQFSMDEEDELLQYAIQQSLLDVGSEGDQVDIWEALKAERPGSAMGVQLPNTPQPSRANRNLLPARPSSSLGFRLSPEEELLQRAIEASLGMPAGGRNPIMDGVENESREQLPNGPGDNDLFAGPAERTSAAAGRAVEEEEERAMLAEALAISARETALEEERRTKEDDELLRRILELSLVEK